MASGDADFSDRRSVLSASAAFALGLVAEQSSVPPLALAEDDEDTKPVAVYALRRAGGLPASLTPVGLGLKVRFGETILASTDGTRSNDRDVYASFEFPADWLMLDRITGGVQYVDQRNGDKLYLLRADLPEGKDLDSVPKAWFGDAIFNPKGDLVRGGNPVEGYRVSSSISSRQNVPCPGSAGGGDGCSVSRRRLQVKYSTVTGNGLSVERRGLVDAYEYGGVVYMLVTGSNAVNFEKKGKERETVEAIVDSFRIVH